MFTPKNTFRSFINGPNGQQNTFAYGAALAVAANPGKAFNPLFLHGGVGLGKTQLLHAIGQGVTKNNKRARVAYLSAEQFSGEFIAAIQHNQVAQFREKYLQIDVLLIDDVEFLVGKARLQEEVFHTFLRLHEQHRQIVMVGNCSSSEIEELERSLVSRFEWGLVAGLHCFVLETHLPLHAKRTS